MEVELNKKFLFISQFSFIKKKGGMYKVCGFLAQNYCAENLAQSFCTGTVRNGFAQLVILSWGVILSTDLVE